MSLRPRVAILRHILYCVLSVSTCVRHISKEKGPIVPIVGLRNLSFLFRVPNLPTYSVSDSVTKHDILPLFATAFTAESNENKDKESVNVRVRFAPSPTGELHVGNLRTFIYNFLFARKHGGTLILRVDDTDESREVTGSLDTIIHDLKWLGFSWSEGPGSPGKVDEYYQSKRQDAYKEVADLLLQTGKAYRCFCRKEDVQSRRDATEKNSDLTYDKKCRRLRSTAVKKHLREGTEYTVRLSNVDNEEDFILLRSNGMATYNFACAVDDHSHNITHVIRGLDHMDNTYRQIRVLDAVGTALPKYVHCSLMRNKDLSKLAKRLDDSIKISDLREMGFCKLPIVNYLALLGTKYADDPVCRDFDALADMFDLDLLNLAPIAFDLCKLKWLNRRYIVDLSYKQFMEQLREYLSETAAELTFPMDALLRVLENAPISLKNGVDTMREYVSLIESALLYTPPRFVGADSCSFGGIFLNHESQRFLETFIEWSQQIVEASDVGGSIHSLFKEMIKSEEFTAIDGRAHLSVVRYALTGVTRGPPLNAMADLWRMAEIQSLDGFVTLRDRILKLSDLDLSSDPISRRLFFTDPRDQDTSSVHGES
ncbi:Glutamate--tRNA ligase [Babesia sp. Xinjiang]|uniref:Glutamate--tRNA ligase n=1 Tax=Babesia sp. Xinjiang TaxID=462227 RepID=UPI000A257372|nr:Glutamate--tRNA ligase [Babesia sp. Xinjiang]ORM39467.1 Glutamate--tRNA ligase [Babesia sp. Xinjiang]